MKKLSKEQVKEFFKNYKKEILIGGAVVIGGTMLCVLTGKKLKSLEKGCKISGLSPIKPYVKLDIPENVAFMGVSEIASHDPEEYVDIWLEMTSLRDLGEFGKTLIDTYGWDPDSTMRGVISTEFVAGD